MRLTDVNQYDPGHRECLKPMVVIWQGVGVDEEDSRQSE